MEKLRKLILQSGLLILLVLGFGLFYYFNLYKYLNHHTIKNHQEILLSWTHQHYILTVFCYLLIYIFIVAFSVPGAIYITLSGGFLFGPIATLYVVVSATVGAIILFFAVRTIGERLTNKASGWILKMEQGFQENAFNYLLFLRLIPLFPFWMINIVAALLNVSFKTFTLATFIGIIPGTFVYVMVGNGLSTLFKSNETPNLNIIFTPPIFLPLLGLAILTLLPIIYKRKKQSK